MAWWHYLASALLAALVSIGLRNELLALTATVTGHLHIDSSRLVHWENSTALNNGDCVVNHIANACEDVKIHFASSTAFLACGDPIGRTHWYPPACRHDAAARSEVSFREHLFKYDIKTGVTTELKVEGLEGDFVTHGIDLFQVDGERNKVTTRNTWVMR